MIADLFDLEALVGQYDSGIVLVGPLLSLSLSSSFRYFYIAGKGSKVYQFIRLGFVENEAIAEKQRTDLIKKLEKRFAQVVTFGSHLEMADDVHTRWPNEETARVLASAAQAGKSAPAKAAGQCENIDDDNHAAAAPSDYSGQHADKVAREAGDQEKGIGAAWMSRPSSEGDQDLPMPHLPRAPTLAPPPSAPVAAPNGSLSGKHAITQPQRYAGLTEDDIASAVSRLVKAHAHQGDQQGAQQDKLPRQSVERPRSTASIVLRFFAVGGAVAVVALATVLLTTPHVADEGAPAASPPLLISGYGDKEPSQGAATPTPSVPSQVAAVNQASQAEPAPAVIPPSPPLQPSQAVSARGEAAPVSVNSASSDLDSARQPTTQTSAAALPSLPNQLVETNEPAQQVESASTAPPPSPSSQPSQDARGDTAPASRLQSPQGQGNSSGERLDAEEIVALVNRAEDSLKNGDLASARLLLRHAAEAIPHAVASVPVIPVDRDKGPAPIATAVAPSPLNQLALQAESAPVSPSPPSPMARAQTEPAAVTTPPSSSPPPSPMANDQTGPAAGTTPPSSSSPPSPMASAQTEPAAVTTPPSSSSPPSPMANDQTGPAAGTTPPSSSPPPSLSGWQPSPTPQGNTTVHLEADEIFALVNRGMDFLKNGDLVSARLLLRRAAEAGNASAALMLGATFDPLIIQQTGAVGIQPDVNKAREWYEKAAKLGSELAAQELAKLAKTVQ